VRHEAEFIDDQQFVASDLFLKARQLAVVAGFDQFMDQGGGGGKADAVALLTGRQTSCESMDSRACHFDAVIDFDSVVRYPQHPDNLLAAYGCGDHLHPSPAGYKAMGSAIPLSLFAQ
jgi:hypothetical protein